MQKLKANTEKRMDDLQNPKNASKKKIDKGIDLGLSVEDIMQRMEQLKEKVVMEQDTAERERIITRIQALNSAWMELTGEKDTVAGSDAKTSGKDLATSLKDDLAKYTTQLKEMQAQEDTQRDEVEDMREKMNASQPVIDRLRQEREVCLTVVRSLWDKIKAINEEYSGMFDSYKEELKEWNARMDVIMADRCALNRLPGGMSPCWASLPCSAVSCIIPTCILSTPSITGSLILRSFIGHRYCHWYIHSVVLIGWHCSGQWPSCVAAARLPQLLHSWEAHSP